MKTLTEIGNQYYTDKNTCFPGPSKHGYTEIYPKYLEPLRDKPIKMSEIGVVLTPPGGASIHMWQEYFPLAEIHAVDILPIAHLDNERTFTHQGNATDPAFLATLPDNFDLIIDDASHISGEQIATFKLLFPKVKPGGWYVIEDLSIPGIPNSCGIDNDKTTVFIEKREFCASAVHWHFDMQGQFAICFIQKG